MSANINGYESFKNKHQNQDCVILSCGPSLKEYDQDDIKDFIKDKIVVCIKEAIIEYKDDCDYFFYNNTRIRDYDFNEKTIKVYQAKPNNISKIINYDILFKEDLSVFVKNKSKQLLKTHDFDKFNLDNNPLRPWGPGILYESVFYFLHYMGINNVYTIGWDLTDGKTGKLTHYFDDDKDSKYKNSKRWNNTNFKDEMCMVNANITHMYDYFAERGMNIIVCGEQSFVNEHIPRFYL